MDLSLIITLLVSFAILFIGFLVYLHNRRSASNILFFLISISTVFWSIARYFSVVSSAENALYWIRLDLFFSIPHAVIFFLFVYTFPKDKLSISKKILIPLLLVAAVTAVATLSPYVYSQITKVDSQIVPQPGVLMPLFALNIIGFVFAGIFIAVYKYLKSAHTEKIRWKFMLYGISISYSLIVITNFLLVVLFGKTLFIRFGPLFMLPMIIGSAYAIVEHGIFNIKVITTEIFTFVILIISFIEVVLSNTFLESILRVSIFILFFIFSIFLIKSVLREVQQRERLEALAEQLAKANAELKTLDQAKSEFISIASHQMRSPLTVIKGYISLIKEGSINMNTDKGEETLNRIAISTDRLIKLVNNMLNLSRIEAGRMRYEFTKENIKKIVKDVMENLQGYAAEKNITIEFKDNAPDLPDFYFDREKIQEVIMNLVDNAIKYSADGKIELFLYYPEGRKDQIVLKVKDNGMGINPKDIPRLFNKFVRTAEAQKIDPGGSGIGLYFARRVVEDHQGGIWAKSEGIGKGTEFYMQLPIRENPE